MKVIQFDEAVCRRIRARLDAYLSDELQVEAAAEVARHLDGCSSCASELAAMEDLRAQVRRAVRGEAVPEGLRTGVLARLSQERRASTSPVRARASVAAAVLVLLGAGSMASKKVTGYLPHELLENELYIRDLARQAAASFGPAIVDHVHCALHRSYPDDEPSLELIAEELGESAELADIVREAAPEGFQLRLAHRCEWMGREFLHLVLMEGEALASVILTVKREGEALELSPQSEDAGPFEIAGFEAADYLAFVISNAGKERNMQLARNLVAPLRRYLG